MKKLPTILAGLLCVCFLELGQAAFSRNTSTTVYPELDIKCNGLDTGVEINEAESVRLTIDVAAHDFSGYPCEVWVLGINKTTGAVYTHGPHPNALWLPGARNCFYTGGLADYRRPCLVHLRQWSDRGAHNSFLDRLQARSRSGAVVPVTRSHDTLRSGERLLHR